jgi:8-oxo-dGTP pyrophosphatase MutT (NUDIX family)
MQKEVSAGIILYNDVNGRKEFLVLKYPGGHWDFVKGKIENSEEPKQTAIRETKEETGIIDVEFIDGFYEEISYTFYVKNEEIGKKVIFYLGKTKSTDVLLSHEHIDFVWLDFDDAIEKITYDNAKRILVKANNILQDRI